MSVGSPLKKARPSIGGADAESAKILANFPPALGDVLARAEAAQAAREKQTAISSAALTSHPMEEEEEL